MRRDWLVEYRNLLNCTHQEVANHCNITRPYYTQIELGTRNPSVAAAKKIAKFLKFNWTIFFRENCNVKKQFKTGNLDETCDLTESPKPQAS